MRFRLIFIVGLMMVMTAFASANNCVDCHKNLQPNIVIDWELSKHSVNEIYCSTCHGEAHNTDQDYAKAKIPTPETCAECHDTQVKQFSKGKHALAWAAMKAMPTIHHQPSALIEGMKGCGGCHKIGLKSTEEIKQLQQEGRGFGLASCDACHTRHTFSVKEARQPQACQTCHMGFDHPQWEMYSASKHGVRYLLKQNGTLPEDTPAPTCQDCHMQDGNHEVRTAWGFLAVKLPLPEDEQWKADQITILQALGVLDLAGKPTARLDVVKVADLARLTQEDYNKEREKMLNTCSGCHSRNFAREQLQRGDMMIKEVDHLLAQAIREIAGLYAEGILQNPQDYTKKFPDLLTFHDAPTVVEQRLFEMHLKHRMRAFQGVFHANPDYALWYGWSEMQRDLTEIKTMAEDLRHKK
jgi:hydroxylamine dehydrogenase